MVGRGSWKHAFCQSSPGNSDIVPCGRYLKKGITIAHIFLLGLVAQPGLFALMNMSVWISLCVCHWVLVSLGKHCFMHLFVSCVCGCHMHCPE